MGLTRPRAHQLQDSDYKQSARLLSDSNVTVGGSAPATLDGASVSLKDRILVTGQTDASQNGLYYVTVVGSGANGTWARSKDADATGDITAGMTVLVTEGSSHADTSWKLTTDDPITLGTTDLAFSQASAQAFGIISAGGNSLLADSVGDTLTFADGTNIAVTGNVSTDTVTISVSSAPTFTGNITGGNLITGAQVVATGNITGGNVASTRGVFTNIAGTLETVAQTNITSVGTLSAVTVTANIAGGNLITGGKVVATGDIETTGGEFLVKARGEVRLYDTDSSNYVGLRAGSIISSDITFSLPVQDGTSGQVLQTDGAKNLTFVTSSGSGGSSGFTNSTLTTHPAADGNKSLGTGSDDVTEETPFTAGGADAFGVSLGLVYDQMEPIGSYVTLDLGDSEAYVGA